MTAVLLALAGAVTYGVSDFLGGVWSRRSSVWPVALTACAGALLGAVVLATLEPGMPRPVDFWWGALAGLGSGSGTAFLYRGLARGRMGVVAPVSAVGAALVPVLVGVVAGERPALVAWLGIVVAFPGIWLAASDDPEHAPTAAGSGLTDGILAGLSFGLLFSALAQVPAASGFWPLAVNQVVSIVAVSACCLLMGGNPIPRARMEYGGLVCGVLATVAVWCFLVATQQGLLTVSSVLVSLYPATTVVLAVMFLREHLHRPQIAGLGLCCLAVVLVALS